MSTKASIEYQEAIKGLKSEVLKLGDIVDEEMEQAFFDIGAIIQRQVIGSLPRSDKEVDVRKSTRKKHHHLQDDVKYWVGKSKKSGQRYVSIYGGRNTGYKWGWINDGYVNAKSQNFVPGIHFLEKALLRAEGMIESTVDDYLEEACKE